jgi:hypothetical protein
MPTSARTTLRFFGRIAEVGIRAPEQNGLLQLVLPGTGNLKVELQQEKTPARSWSSRFSVLPEQGNRVYDSDYCFSFSSEREMRLGRGT